MDSTELDELLTLVAESVAATARPDAGGVFRPALRERLMAQVSAPARFTLAADQGQWIDTPIAGITMKVLSLDTAGDSAVLLVKGTPGARYPAHRHTKAEECYVISGEVLIHGQM